MKGWHGRLHEGLRSFPVDWQTVEYAEYNNIWDQHYPQGSFGARGRGRGRHSRAAPLL
jgi:hypothetical protein